MRINFAPFLSTLRTKNKGVFIERQSLLDSIRKFCFIVLSRASIQARITLSHSFQRPFKQVPTIISLHFVFALANFTFYLLIEPKSPSTGKKKLNQDTILLTISDFVRHKKTPKKKQLEGTYSGRTWGKGELLTKLQ